MTDNIFERVEFEELDRTKDQWYTKVDHMSEEAKGLDFCYTSEPTDQFNMVIEDGDARVKCIKCKKIPAFIGDEGCEVVSLIDDLVVKLRPHECNCNMMQQYNCDCWPGYEMKIEPGSRYPADILDHLKALYGEEKTLEFLRSIGGRVVGEFARQVRMEANTMGCGPSAEGIRNCTYNFVAEAEKAGPWPKALLSLFRP